MINTGPWVFNSLPESIKKEAECTITDDFHFNNHLDEYVWERKKVRITTAAESLLEQVEGDEDFMNHAIEIGKSIKSTGQQEPIIIGPCSIEGNHRLVGAYLAGLKTLDAIVCRRAPELAKTLEIKSIKAPKP